MQQKDIAYGLGAYAIWGILPIYWKLLQVFHPMALLSIRIVLAGLFLVILLRAQKRWPELIAAVKNKQVRGYIVWAALFITINWGVYIWAVNNAFIVEASLGYFINPLVAVAFGILFYKEKLTPVLWICIGLALTGIGIMTYVYARIPWIALALAFSFGLYAVVKKRIPVESAISLAMETVAIAPFALMTLVGLTLSGVIVSREPVAGEIVISLFAGIITAIPLLLFGVAAKRLPMYVIGFLQYLAPTLQLLIGVLLYKESFTPTYLLAFSFIWCAVILFTISQVVDAKKRQNAQRSHAESA